MTAPISIEYAAPPPELGDRISSLYSLRQNDVEYSEIERADRAQFRVTLSGGGEYQFSDGHADPACAVTIIGPTSGIVCGYGFGPMHVVGAGLHPAAWGALMGANAEGWANRAIDATAILGDTALDLHKAICAATQTSQRFDILCTFLAAATDEAMKTIATEFIHMMDAWLSERIDPEIDVLVQRTGLGMRQIERLAKRYYGLPPKTLARKYRALRVAAAMARGANLDELGLGDTFYDQSHLIRELKRFAGLTPQQIAQHQSSMLLETSKGRKSLEGQVSSLVSDA